MKQQGVTHKICFVVDCSASMNKKSNGEGSMSLLDCSKAAIEHFMYKRYSRDPQSVKHERYLLITTHEGWSSVRVYWGDAGVFSEAVKNLVATTLSSLGNSIQVAFDLLNLYRIIEGTDTYGQGRMPWINNATLIVVISDGDSFCSIDGGGPSQHLTMKTGSLPGAQLTAEPFRWDQRIFSVVFSGLPTTGIPGEQPVEGRGVQSLRAMSTVTGGTLQTPTTLPQLLQTMEGLSAQFGSRSPSGVVLNFCPSVRSNSVPPSLPQFVMPSATTGSRKWWPLPEDYLSLDHHQFSGDPARGVGAFTRTAQPALYFEVSAGKVMNILPKFPVDRYELQRGSALSRYFLSTCKQRGLAWPVHTVPNHKVLQVGQDGKRVEQRGYNLIGFLRSSTARHDVVYLYVLPYDYPMLFSLLAELIQQHQMNPPVEWSRKFQVYLRNLPYYYIDPLRQALLHMKLPKLVPDNFGGGSNTPQGVTSLLTRLSERSKVEAERIEGLIQQCQREKSKAKAKKGKGQVELSDMSDQQLDSHIAMLRGGHKRQDLDKFQLPISHMGNFQAHLSSKSAPLRTVEEAGEGRSAPLFGNPFFAVHKVSNRISKRALVRDESEDMMLPFRVRSPRHKKTPSPGDSPILSPDNLHSTTGGNRPKMASPELHQ